MTLISPRTVNTTSASDTGSETVTQLGDSVVLGGVTGYSINVKNGRNPTIGTGTTPEDMWNGGGLYTGFNATSGENLEIFSSSASDTGTLVSSGTATGGTATTIIDSSATFITDAVAVLDLVINDTLLAHGVVKSVDSETQLTVWIMEGKANTDYVNASGNSYRVASPSSTGAAVILSSQLLNGNFEEQDRKYTILNGTSSVIVTGSYMRSTRDEIVLAGSSGNNVGEITVRQQTTTANIFSKKGAGIGKTTIGAFSVPKGKKAVMKRVGFTLTRGNGSAGSATVILFSRTGFGAWRGTPFEISTSQKVNEIQIGGRVFTQYTDIKQNILSVSDNDSILDGFMEYYLIDI